MGQSGNEKNQNMNVNREKLSYRQGVVAVILSKNGKILLVQMRRYEENEWRFPGGGIEEGETAEEAIIRELQEELGSDKFQIERKSKYVNQYEWPDEVIQRRILEKGQAWRGQQQQQFLIRFGGNEEDLTPSQSELKQVKWATREELKELLIFPNQLELAEKVINELLS